MAFTVSQTPPFVALAGNPAYYTIETDDITGTFYRLQLQFHNQTELVAQDSLECYAKKATFDVSQFMKSLFPYYNWTYQPSAIVLKTDFLQSYFIKHCEVYYIGATRYQGTLTTEAVKYAINGRLPEMIDNFYRTENSSFYEVLQNGQLFLTLQPREKRITKSQPERLYFLNYSPSVSSVAICITLTFADGSTQHIISEGYAVDNPAIYQICVGFAELQLYTYETTKQIAQYTVYLKSQTNAVISETLTYNIDSRQFPHLRFIVFRNRVGGYDTVHCTGLDKSENEIENIIGKTFAGKRKLLSFSEIRYKANTGLRNPEYITYLQEIYESTDVYEISAAGIYRITIENTKTNITEGDQFLFSQDLEYTRDQLIGHVPVFPPQVTADYSILDYSNDYFV
jgi:hypothetical protein